MWEQGEGCSAFRVHEDVYKEMPHHVVGSTSWVVTGFFTDVLGSSMAWINFCHSKLPSWIQNIPELCVCTRDSALATTCIQSLLSCWSVQLSLASVPIFSSVSLSLVQIESAFFLAVLKGCRKFCVERSLVLLWAGENSSLCASLHIWIISNPHTDTALHRPVSSSSTQPCKSKPKAFIENFDTYICISKQVFRAVWKSLPAGSWTVCAIIDPTLIPHDLFWSGFRHAGWEEHPSPSLTSPGHFYFSLSRAFPYLFSALEKWRKCYLMYHEMFCNFSVVASQR